MLLQVFHLKSSLTVIMVTHNPELAQCGNRIIKFLDGRLVSDEKVTNQHQLT